MKYNRTPISVVPKKQYEKLKDELATYKRFYRFTIIATWVIYTIVGIGIGWIIFVRFGVWN